MKGVSVIICCYNSAERLPETIGHLLKQSDVRFEWEIIIVDNNSTDNTKEIASKLLNKEQIPFSILEEKQQGLSFAREKGIESSRFDYLLFCDDDNWLFHDYLKLAYSILSENAEIGALGGIGIPKTEVPPEPWVDLALFATGPQSDKNGDISNSKRAVYGASSLYRKEALSHLKNKGFKSYLSDRKGDILSSGGDYELCYALCLAGYKIWYDDRLKFYHYIPRKRLTFDYLKRLEFGNGYSSVLFFPYLFLLENRRPGKFKRTWWWRYLAGLTILLRRKFPEDTPSEVKTLHNLRFKGYLSGLVKERKNFTRLLNDLETAKWKKLQ